MLNLHSRFSVVSAILTVAMLAAAGCKKSSSSPAVPVPAPPPVIAITGVTPVSGDISGGTVITVSGTGFISGATLDVGGNAATVTSVSGIAIIATVPAGAAGPATILVTNPDTTSATLTNGFTYTSGTAPAPTVTSLVPTFGVTGGGTTVTLTGTGFQTGATVTVGGGLATNVNVTSAGTMTFDTPAGTTGSATIVLTNPDAQSATVTNGFTFGTPAPTVASITPVSGPDTGGTTVTLSGTGFQNSGATQATVSIGGVACTNVQVLTAATIVCDTGASTNVGPQNVVVTNPDAQSATLTNGYSYIGPNPTVTGITPTVGAQGGGTVITITGTNFFPGATVTVGGVTATITSVTSTQIIATTNAGSNGPQTVVVTNLDGNTVSAPGGFVYQGAAPTITNVNPTSGPQGGANSVVITGTNFRTSATVLFGANAATVTGNTGTTLTVTVPSAATAGAVNVTVNNIDLTTVTATNAYTYNTGPAITSIVPNNGAPGGGNTVTINGANFALPITSVTFGSNAATVQGTPTTSQIIVTAPAGAVGAVTVTVTVSGGATATTTYTYNAAPAITSITANNGPLAGGNSVVIAGTGFINPVASVTFGGVAGTVTAESATSITVTVPGPATAGAVNVVVTNPDTQTATSTGGYTYNPLPTITTIAANNGALAGGNSVVITGTGFINPVTSVTFGGVAGTVTAQSATSITVTVPGPAAAGAVNVVVTNPDTQTATSTGGYTYNPLPTITTIAANNGALAGGNSVVITGTGFINPVTSVTFGGVAGTVTAQSATSITVTVPGPATAGAVNVVVTNPDTQSATSTGGYTYNPLPTITSIAANNGPLAGGNAVVITGTGFINPVTSVTFGGVAGTVTAQSATSITVTVPGPATAGAVNVVVTNPDAQTATSTGGYTYNPLPTIATIVANNGALAGGNAVVITGTGFINPVTSVTFGGVAGTVTAQSATSITVTVPGPATAGAVNVVVTNPDTQSATSTGGYTYNPLPTITSITANSGPQGGGNSVVIAGTGFINNVTSVTFGGVAATVTLESTTSITVTVPASATTGAVNVVVTNPDSQAATSTGGYTYVTGPTITSIAANNGLLAGGNSVTITGANFALPISSVTFGANAGTVTGTPTSTQIIVTVPTGTAGAVTVTVTVNGGATATTTYTYNPLPTISTIVANNGALAGGNAVVITGTGFINPVTSVTFGGVAGTVTAESATSITVTVPGPATAGAVNVVVTNPDTQAATSTGGYTYNPLPTITLITPNSGPLAGGNSVVITGTGFINNVTSVTFGGVAGTVTLESTTSITVTVPGPASAGAVNVVVTNPDTQAATSTGGYTYTAAALPTLTLVAPASGPETGGQTITLTGTNFVAPASVTVNGVAATGVAVGSTTSVTAVTPVGTPGGPYTVSITTPGGTANLASAYTYLPVQTQLLSSETTFGFQSGNVDLLSSPGDAQLNQKIGAFFGDGTTTTCIAYYHSGASPTKILVGTAAAGAFLSTDGGSTWSSVWNLSTSPALPSNVVLSVGFFSGGNSGNTFIIGTDTGAVLTTDGGTTFTLYNTTSSPALPANQVSAVSFFDGNTTGSRFLMACNANNPFGAGGAVWTTDGGASFTLLDAADSALTTAGGFNDNVKGVAYFSGDTVGNTFLIASDGITFFGSGGAYITRNGGTSYARYHTGSTTVFPDNDAETVAFHNGTAAGDIWLVGYNAGGGAVRMDDTGGTPVLFQWTTATGVALPSNNVFGVSYSTNVNTFAIATDTGVVHTTDGGKPNNPQQGSFITLDTGSTPATTDDNIAGVDWFKGTTTAIYGIATGTRTAANSAGAAEEVTGVGATLGISGYTALPAPNLLPHDDVRDVALFTPSTGTGTGLLMLAATPSGAARSLDGGATWAIWDVAGVTGWPSDNVTSVAWYEGNTTGSNCVVGTAGGVVVVTAANTATPTFTVLTTTQGLTSNAVTDVAYYSGSGTVTDTLLVGYGANGVDVVTTALGTPAISNFTNATPANWTASANVSSVDFYNGATNANTWVVGTNTGLVVTTGNGTNGTTQTLNNGTPAAWTLNSAVQSVSFHDGSASADNILAGVTNGVVSITAFSGTPAFTMINAGMAGNDAEGVEFFHGNTTGTHFAVCSGGAGGGLSLTTDGGTNFTVYDTTTSLRLPSNRVAAMDYDDSVAAANRYLVGYEAAAVGRAGGASYETGTSYVSAGTFTVGDTLNGDVMPMTSPVGPTFHDNYVRRVAYWDGNTTGSNFIAGGRLGAAMTAGGAAPATALFTVIVEGAPVTFANEDVRDVAYYDGDTTAGTWLIGTAQGAFLTTNGGTSYTHFHTGSTPALPSDDVRCVAINESSTAALRFLVGTALGVARTNNGGGAFTVYDAAAGWTDPVQCCDYFDGDTTGQTWAVGGPTGQGIFHTTDDATSVVNLTFGNGAPGSSNIRDLAYLTGDTTGQTVLCAHGPSGGQSGASLSTNFSSTGVTTWTLFNNTTVTGWPNNAVISVDYFNGTTNSTTVLVGHAGGVSFSTNITAATPTWTHHSTTNGLPSNDVRDVAFHSGSATANTWVVATDGGLVHTANSGTNYNVFRRGTMSSYLLVNVSETKPANTNITYDILDATGTPISGFTALSPDGSGNIDISGINIGTYPSIQVRANLSTTVTTSTPVLHSVQVRYQY